MYRTDQESSLEEQCADVWTPPVYYAKEDIKAVRSMIEVCKQIKQLDTDRAKSACDTLIEEKEDFQKQKDQFEKRHYQQEIKFTSTRKSLESEKNKLSRENDRILEEKNQMKVAFEQKSEELNQMKTEYEKMKTEYEKMKITNDALKKEVEKLSKSNMAQKHETNTQDENDISQGKSESHKTTEDNEKGAITSTNSATKIAEKYNELYDNQWTDAFEGLSTYQEKDAIKTLLNILKECYQTCEETAAKQLESLQVILRTPTTPGNLTFQSSPSKVGDRIEKTTNKMLKDCRKLMAEEAVEDVAKKLVTRHSRSVDANFVKKCIELCWLMAVQDPPVVLGKEVLCGEKFNSDHYRGYTSTGPVVEYTVWLPLMLHKNGPLLCKGVAQPIKRQKTTSATLKPTPVAKAQETYHPKEEERYKPNRYDDFTHGQTSHDFTKRWQETTFDAGIHNRNYVTEVVPPTYDETAHHLINTPTYQYQEPQNYKITTYGNRNAIKDGTEEPKVHTFNNKQFTVSRDKYGHTVYYHLFKRDGVLYVEYNHQTYTYDAFKWYMGF